MQLQTALENLEFFAYHGMYEEEKMNGGIFKVSLWIDEEVADHKDLSVIENLINYENLHAIVREQMQLRKEFIEDLAREILNAIIAHLPGRTFTVRVKIIKPDPAGRFGSGSAAVTLEKRVSTHS